MKKERHTGTTRFQAEKIKGTDISVEFTKVVTETNERIGAKILKGDAEAGTLSADTNGNALYLGIRKYTEFSHEDLAALFKALPGYIKEVAES